MTKGIDSWEQLEKGWVSGGLKGIEPVGQEEWQWESGCH